MNFNLDPNNPIFGYIGIILLILFFVLRKKYKINKEAKYKLAVERKMEELKNKEK